jgi:hypothetical protein
MKKQFIQLTTGWIPVSVLGMLMVALVAGQARANLSAELKAVPTAPITASVNVVLHADVVKKLEALPLVVDALLALPSDLDVNIDTRIISPLNGGDYSSRPNSE